MGNSVARPLAAALVAMVAVCGTGAAAAAQDPDEADLAKNFETVDVWHFPVDTTVRYNNQDAVVTRELVFKDGTPKGDLCYVRFDLVKGEGDYGYGFNPDAGARKNTVWGVNVLKRGTVLDQYYSAVRLNVVYFFVDGPKSDGAKEVCARKQAAATAEAGNAYKGPWADLITKAKAVHGWPAAAGK